MSTAILHAGSFIHDFNDIVIKVCDYLNYIFYIEKCHIRNLTEQKKILSFKKHMFFASIIFFRRVYKQFLVNSISQTPH